jgi:hypothetical protein
LPHLHRISRRRRPSPRLPVSHWSPSCRRTDMKAIRAEIPGRLGRRPAWSSPAGHHPSSVPPQAHVAPPHTLSPSSSVGLHLPLPPVAPAAIYGHL